MRIILNIIVLCFVFTKSFAQDFSTSYHPIRESRISKSELKALITRNTTIAQKRTMKNFDAKTDFIKIVKNFYRNFAELDTQRVIIYNDTVARYLSKIVEEIKSSNSLLSDRKITVFVLRDDEVNASNWGPEIILVNYGLIAHASSHEEVVFTLCHELAHEYLDHCYQSIENRCMEINSTNFKRKWRKIKRSEYNSVKQAEVFTAVTLAKLMVNQREQELEADSLGFVFYKNIGLDKLHALNDIRNLDSAEVPYYHKKLDFKSEYDPEGLFFDNEWNKKPDGKYDWGRDSSMWVLPDSLKTHPDCPLRTNKLEQYSLTMDVGKTADQSAFLYIRNVCRFEILEEFLSNEDYANALYYATQLREYFPKNVYLNNVIVNSFIEMSNALKEHRFSEVVDHPYWFYYPGIKDLLHFLHNLNSEALRKFAINHFNKTLTSITNDSFTAYNAILIKAWETPKDKQVELIEVYSKNFSEKFYLSKLEKKLKPQMKKR